VAFSTSYVEIIPANKEVPVTRILATLFFGLTLSTIIAGCTVREGAGCRYGWVEGHHDAYGRWIPGHCR
jgi:hypothetical protein